jgi:F-BAR domain only protein
MLIDDRCKVKMTGDMMVSFPAGIIQVFANNPSPAPLRFQVRSKQKLENLISNKNLVKV